MYGQVHTDTLHAIDLGVSRRLTGDALLVPVMKAHIEEQDHQYDSLKKNYSEIIGESKIQLEASGEKVRMLSELATMWETTAIEQNKARTEDEKRWKKKRTIERVIEGVIVVGVVILAL
jgi:hypothetical protein